MVSHNTDHLWVLTGVETSAVAVVHTSKCKVRFVVGVHVIELRVVRVCLELLDWVLWHVMSLHISYGGQGGFHPC